MPLIYFIILILTRLSHILFSSFFSIIGFGLRLFYVYCYRFSCYMLNLFTILGVGYVVYLLRSLQSEVRQLREEMNRRARQSSNAPPATINPLPRRSRSRSHVTHPRAERAVSSTSGYETVAELSESSLP